MANQKEIKVPDIGGANQVDVIEILVKVGDQIDIDTSLITLESDKASMDIPASSAGIVSSISVKVGDKVSEGDLILVVKTEEDSKSESKNETNTKQESSSESNNTEKELDQQSKDSNNNISKNNENITKTNTINISIPDIGGATNVDVIDILVKEGMSIEKDQALVTLEGDKATMDIPSPHAGIIKKISMKLGDKVSQGTDILVLETNDLSEKANSNKTEDKEVNVKEEEQEKEEKTTAISDENKSYNDTNVQTTTPFNESVTQTSSQIIAAGPAVRRMAREFGINLINVKGSGRKMRVTKEDLQTYVKTRLQAQSTTTSFGFTSNPVIDFSKFGETEAKALNKIKKLTGVNVHRAWVTIPHVTQFDEADITDLESFRKSETDRVKDSSYKLTLLAFVCAVVCKALQKFPQFNASLDATGEQLIYKKYYNIGIAVETPNGLVVPVIKGIETLSISQIAQEMSKLSAKARDKGLSPADMSGGCFTISSLGGIGGTAFTPIVNSPEVAILGLSRSVIKPVYENNEFKPRLMLPLSLSYDHRVIDGAEAARFTRYISESLNDIKRILI